jgi:hypothetical protein
MKLFFINLIFLIFLSNILIAQEIARIDTTNSIYGSLPVLKEYAVSSSSLRSASTSWFKLNGKEVDEKTYQKYTQFSDNINKCKPCILLSYDTSENLLYKRITYGDCAVGYWIEYYPNGKVKVIGHYKENSSRKWENIFDNGYCRKHGSWIYFDKSGIRIRSEIWKEGKLEKKRNK